MNETLKLMGRSAGDRLTPEVAREVCQRTGSKAMLTGSIAGLGSQYVIGLKAVNCNTGDVLAEAQEQAAGKEAVLKALDAAAVSLREQAGRVAQLGAEVRHAAGGSDHAIAGGAESLQPGTIRRTMRKGTPPLCPSTSGQWNSTRISPWPTRHVDRLQQPQRSRAGGGECTQGLRAAGEGERAGAVRYRGDLLHVRNGRAGEGGADLRTVAADLPEGLFAVREPGIHLRQPWKLGKGIGGSPCRQCAWNRTTRTTTSTSAPTTRTSTGWMKRRRCIKQAEERKLEGEFLLSDRYQLAFLKGDAAQMAQLAAAAMGKPGTEDLLLAAQADTEGWYGKLKNARELTRRAMDSAQHNDAKETAATYQAAAALREVESGNRNAGACRCRCGTEAGPEPRCAGDGGAGPGAGRRYGRGGEAGGRTRQDIPAGHAGPEVLAAHDPGGRRLAAQRPEPGSRTIEGGEPDRTRPAHGHRLCTYAQFICGEKPISCCTTATRRQRNFRSSSTTTALVVNFPWGALARLGLARAYALDAATDPAARDKARTAYQNFLTLWKDADPDIPIYQQAKAEYAKLH